MENQPEVNIILPIYNAGAALAETLASIARQTYPNMRLICVDDGSTDGSGALADQLAAQCAFPAEVVHTANHGSYAAREAGIARATGELVGFCDAGDIMGERAVEVMARRAVLAEADIVACAFRRVKGGEAHVEMGAFANKTADLGASSGWLASVNTALWNKLVRRELLEGRLVLDEPPRIGEDALFLMPLYARAKRISFAGEALYDYRVTGNSNMSRLDLVELERMVAAWQCAKRHATGANPQFAPIFDLAAMVHLGVSAPLVMLGESRAKAVQGAAAAKRALDASFPLYRRSPFVTRAYVNAHPTMRNVRLMHFAVANGLMPQALGAYGFLRDTLHVNLGW